MSATQGQAAVTTLKNCFTSAPDYAAQFSRELSTTENVANRSLMISDHIVGSGGELTASCDCPSNIFASSTVYELTLASSPLSAGISGYGYLTENVDIDVEGYSDAINSPDGSGIFGLKINNYPTPVSLRPKLIENLKYAEGVASVCSDATRPNGGTTVKRRFKWNVMSMTFYIKKPILGEEVIPPTLVVQNYACLYFGTGGSCNLTYAQHVSNIYFSGVLSAPLNCVINAGSTIEVDFGNLVTNNFVTKGQPPKGFALKDVDISWHCDGSAVGNDDKIKLSLTADHGIAEGSDGLIGKMLNRDDLGVRIFQGSKDVILDGSVEFDVNLDEQGNGKIQLQAAPVSTTAKRPAAGAFEGNMTVKMELR
ncbi:TPA: fimbrial protein [Enterobacter cancerogenus]|nr:fimbrial protein [Enterobacter cancerogenus]HDR2165243.1 fimbrial protein [Enterobacter cancerogenus]HDR2267991.1 fimbrial protein [Enterobacter cancerogenus]